AYFGHTRAVDIVVLRLRKNLGTSGACIHTIYGLGYKLDCCVVFLCLYIELWCLESMGC
ncbi:helix-turn-helix domain-containing protein, partial [Bacillus thuringiensis]|uniref:helix-turn-helix domain-containing protein n=1 Tax=Bacillus thuringiensis TaxID=1428 RepID=UPI00284650EE|nr:winged helix-turn-helix domain-containing protein [Bacillus thuringiensis]